MSKALMLVALASVAGASMSAEDETFRPAPEVQVGRTAAAPVPTPESKLVSLLEQAGRYVVEYERSFQNIVAEEKYTQRVRGAKSYPKALPRPPIQFRDGSSVVITRADVAFVRLDGEIPWGILRDVFEANGVAVRDRDSRLLELFQSPSPSAREQARRILAESARFNMGPRRTLNIPTLPLLFLHPRNQPRFVFRIGGQKKVHGFQAVEVRFEETVRPAIVSDGSGGTLPASGRFWIDPTRGAVLRSEVQFTFEPLRARGVLKTEYRPEPTLGIFVPDEMTETYADIENSPSPLFLLSAEAVAKYTNLRRFGVSVGEEAFDVPTVTP